MDVLCISVTAIVGIIFFTMMLFSAVAIASNRGEQKKQARIEIAKLQIEEARNPPSPIGERLHGVVSEKPIKTADHIDFVGDNIIETYLLPDGSKKYRAIDSSGKDLGMDFTTMSGAIVALDLCGEELIGLT